MPVIPFRFPSRRRLHLLALAALTVSFLPVYLVADVQPSVAEPGGGSANNPWPDDCNMRVGVVVDRSDSIKGASGSNPALVRGAVGDLADRLSGTGASMAVWSFGTLASGYTGSSPLAGAPDDATIVASDYPSIGFTSLGTPAGTAAVKSTANAIPFTNTFNADTDADTRRVGGTNWEAGLGHSSHGFPGAVAPNGDSPRDADVLIFFTDGSPTVSNQQLAAGTPGVDATDAKMNAALVAADEVKNTSAPTRIIGVGVGRVNAPNLERVTAGYPAAEEFEDYWITDFGGLGDALFDVASRICGGSLTLRKLVPGTTPGSWVPRPGWTFHTSYQGGAPAHLEPGTELTTDANGEVTARWLNPAGDTNVAVTEDLSGGQRLHGVTCTQEIDEPGPLRAESGPPEGQERTFAIRVTQHKHVTCDVRNYDNGPELTIEKSADPPSLPRAGDVTFTVSITNPDPIEPVRIDSAVDDRFGDLFDPDNERVRESTCDDSAPGTRVMAPGATGSCTFVARVEPTDDGGPHVDVVTVSGVELLPPGGEGDQIEVSDDATVTFTDLAGPDLEVTKDDGAETLAPGESTSYTLTVTNRGTVPATGVALSDALPDDVTFESASDGGTFDAADDAEDAGRAEGAASEAVVWPWFSLDPGEERVVAVTVRVDEDAEEGAEILNRAVVFDDGTHGDDPTPENNAAEDLDRVERTVLSDGPVTRDPDPTGITGSLPRTGSEASSWVLWGGALLAAGIALVGLARRAPRWHWRWRLPQP